MIDLAGIVMVNGVNPEGAPFITVTAQGNDGTIMVGQLSPAEARDHALHYLAVAEAAEQDAAVLQCFRRLELPDQLAGAVVTELRNMRDE